MDWKVFFEENWAIIIGSVALLLILFFIIFIVGAKKTKTEKQKKDKNLLICPIRGMVRAKKYDTEGNYTEEYQRIRLIRYLLQKKGYPKSYFIIEYAIPIGHKGHNTLRVDLVIKKANQFICVAEVKKGYSEQNRKSAIKHQLIPAMRIVNAKYGIYFDGTPKSCLLSRNNDGTLSARKFP